MSTWSDLKNNPRLKKIYETRIEIIKLIREFFWSKNFVETETPIAVRYAGQEPYLNPVPTIFHNPEGDKFKFYLHTSPEFAMKKLLAAGFPRIFQITKCFRDFENFGGLHNTEFTMIEWYRAPGNYVEIMDDTEKLFKYVAERLGVKVARVKDYKTNVAQKWDRISMRDLWRKFIGVNLDNYLLLEDIKKLAGERGHSIAARDSYEDVFYKIFLNEIEPKLGVERPIFVYDYPAQMTSLCRLRENDSRYAERFELYIGGMEIANAFGELTDADEQLKRLEEDRAKRSSLGKPTWPVDPDFIEALRHLQIQNEQDIEACKRASPAVVSPKMIGSTASHEKHEASLRSSELRRAEAGGIALGVDRMILLFTEAGDLNEVIFQAVKDQIGN
ncbi:MAG: tRNA synthetase class II (D K and N) [Candidatus Magasanikbacteria bacterium GW2011_GWA2_46_17]|uniref:tRNA synthetase class II (D K and N) n=1 Tax=Candidatus Magasanikbacteria bacterium GW2011_GWA2_46_17 TaxID=1619042 RepID=A0A0G1RYI4_9BACT|nr:MAG: tRNA synthetase class II (D K and N) [Candidatus Magasanikbacteria bacterium GW2011_GWA2_46_17]